MGIWKPVHVLPRDAEVEEIVNIAAFAVLDAQETKTQMERECEVKGTPSEEAHTASALQPVQM